MSVERRRQWRSDRLYIRDPGFPRPDPRAARLSDVDELTSVGKALSVLDFFRGKLEPQSVTEVAEANKLPKSTAFRLLTQLVASGLLERDERRYRPSWQVFELAQSSILGRPDGPRSQALPLMTELYVHTRGVVHFGVRRNAQVMVVEKIFGPDSVLVPTRTGARLPLTTTAMGKALLSSQVQAEGPDVIPARLPRLTRNSLVNPRMLADQLARSAERGYTLDREETVVGVSCVGAVVTRGTRPVGAMSVSVRSVAFDEPKLARLVTRYATLLSETLAPPATEK